MDWNKSQRIVCQELKKWSNAKEVPAFVLQDQQSWKPKDGSCKKTKKHNVVNLSLDREHQFVTKRLHIIKNWRHKNRLKNNSFSNEQFSDFTTHKYVTRCSQKEAKGGSNNQEKSKRSRYTKKAKRGSKDQDHKKSTKFIAMEAQKEPKRPAEAYRGSKRLTEVHNVFLQRPTEANGN